MTKTDKKMEKNIRLALTSVCEKALETIDGFQWITHNVDYKKFPDSLTVLCVFDNSVNLSSARTLNQDTELKIWIQKELAKHNIDLRNVDAAVSFNIEHLIH